MDNKSVEPLVADLFNNQLKKYGLDYKLEQDSLNQEIDNALKEYASKQGAKGGNRPDCKLLLRDKTTKEYPILIEYKGYKNRLVKLDNNGKVENKTDKGDEIFKNIKDFAVNGAIHYANALMQYTHYDEIISIGITGWKDESGNLKTEVGVYIVSKQNFGLGQKVGEYKDLSFLSKKYFSDFTEKVHNLSLSSQELENLKAQREDEINYRLIKLNNDIYKNNEFSLSEQARIFLVIATIIATLGIDNEIKPLEKADLKSSNEINNRDGDIILRKIESFFDKKKLPNQKKKYIIEKLKPILEDDYLNKVENGETRLKRIFSTIVDDLGIYYKIGLTTDFTGKLFNEMYNWLGFTQDKLNDVVLTPPYVANLLVKLARTNMNSYVWDFATGSAGLLVQAMNEMINDAKNNLSAEELNNKVISIKANQLLGLEILPEISMLAILNMILMGDGSSNILTQNSLQYDGLYGNETKKEFPADVFVLNPPYSAEGNGMIFVKKAFSMMKRGYGAIIIQSSTGIGQAKEINKEILKNNTLIASIKMPDDLFLGKSNVKTHIYVFKINERHEKDNIVKFIDFSNDGYERSNRKKSSSKLKDLDHAKERYEEIVNLVKFGKNQLHYIKDDEYYEGHINPENGCDWNQTKPIDTKLNISDFKKTVSEYLNWEVSSILKKEENNLGK